MAPVRSNHFTIKSFIFLVAHHVVFFQSNTTISPCTTSNALSPAASIAPRKRPIVHNHHRVAPCLFSHAFRSSEVNQGDSLMASGYEAATTNTYPVENFNTDSSTTMYGKEKIAWMVRPAQLQDKDKVDALLAASYGTLLPASYSPEILSNALPKICNAQESLLTCGTWYVVEDPQTGALVGCGGFTLHAPVPTSDNGGTEGVDVPPSAPRPIQAPHLRHFATDPAHARKGIASAIWNQSWKAIVEHFHAQGQPAPAMEVISSLTAESFYESLGFEKVKSLNVPLGEDCDFPATLMRRPAPAI